MSDHDNALMAPDVPQINALDLSVADQVLDLSALSNAQAAELRMELGKKMIEFQMKKVELTRDLQGLKFKLDTMTESTMKANDKGVSITINHTQSDATGKTEIVIGNTQKSRSGRKFFGCSWIPIFAGILSTVAHGVLLL